MKKLILISIIFFGLPFITYSQIPQIIWNKPIYFQDPTSNHGITDMNFDKVGNIYLAGYDTLNLNPGYNGFLARYNNNFDSLWRKYDPYVWTYEPKAIYEDKDRIIYRNTNMIYTSDSTFLVCRSINNGNKIWQRTMKAYSSGRYGICKYGDSLIIGTKINGSQVNLLILNLNGDTVRTFNANIPINQGSISLDYRDKFIWVKGNTWLSGAISSILSKINLSTNSIVWTRYPGNFSASPKCYLDTNSNYYFADSHQESGLHMKYQVIKYDSSGNTIWSKLWYPSPDTAVNINNWMNGVTVDERRNIIVITGLTDKYKYNSSSRLAYYCIRNSINGDSIYSQIIVPSDTSFSTSIRGLFDQNGFLYTIFTTYKTYGPYYFVMRKYSLTTTNIHLNTNEVASSYSLLQNYPNPFNPATKIRFDVPNGFPLKKQGNDRIVLIIYNALGKEIETLVNDKFSPGTYETTWDGSEYPSGIYFYRLQAGDFSETKRMTLIK